MLGRRGRPKLTPAALAAPAVMGRAAFGAAPVKIAGIHDTSGGFDIYGQPMFARLDYAASEPNEADDMLGRPRAAHQLRPPEQHPAPRAVRDAGQGGGGARRHHLGARQAIRPVLLMEKDADFIRVLSGRVLLIQRGRIVRELPAAGLNEPALEHEFIG